MIQPGTTFRGFDGPNHLFMILSEETPDHEVALANLTTHRPNGPCRGHRCVILMPGEHPFVRHPTCVPYYYALLYPVRKLAAQLEDGKLHEREPLSESLLRRIQRGALAETDINPQVQNVIRATLEKDG